MQRHADEVLAHAEVGAWPCSESSAASRWKSSKSLLASHGGSIAGVKACTNGCMSVEERSCFSYQVAAGQHDVGEQRRRGHPEVGRDQQVELALGRLVVPGHLGRARRLGVLAAHDVVVGAEQVLQEVLVALGRGAHQVGPPQHQRARPVLRGVDVLDRRLQACRRAARRRRMRRRRRRAGVDGRLPPRRPGPAGCGRTAGRTASSPAGRTARSCRRCACRRGAPRPAARSASRRVAVVAPLVGVHVPVRRCRSWCAAAGTSPARWPARSSR